MKKTIAMILSVLMLATLFVPAFAQDDPVALVDHGQVPLVLLGGDGNTIYDENGNAALTFDKAFKKLIGKDGGNGSDTVKESAQNVLLSFIAGIITGNYDPYYEKLQQEIGELTDTLQMDENGNPKYGTDISAKDRATNRARMTTPNKKSVYGYDDYHFWYDWRKDPLEVADELDAYIEAVCAMTGHAQVGLAGRCLGANFVLAYLAKYGYKNRLRGIGFDAGMVGGQDSMSESVSGKFKTDGDSINRYLIDMEQINDESYGDWIRDLVDFAEHAELLDGLSIATRATIYDQLVEGVSSALALSTIYTIPSYWSCVSARDYDDAMRYVFGEEGSKKREKYAGLIEKIENYNVNVRQKQDEILTTYLKNGGNIAIIAKYGFQMTPISQSRTLVSDDLVSVRNASLGATTSMLYNTLDDDYIAGREAEGKGKYISPDKKVDASTCLLPDNVWFLKGYEHSSWSTLENHIIYTVTTADRQYTADDLDCARFMVYRKDTKTFEPMTAENSNTENWTAEAPKEEQPKVSRVFRFLQSLFRVLGRLFDFVREKLGN